MLHIDDEDYRKFVEGDTAGFENLVLRYRKPLTLFIQTYLKDIHLSEDIAQDTFADIFVHRERYNIGNGFKTYLYTIGKNKAIDKIRKEHRIISYADIPEDTEQIRLSEPLLEEVIRKEDAGLMYKCLIKLKKDYKRVIILIDFMDMSYVEAAKVMNKTTPQIKVLIHRARQSLKKELIKEGYHHAG